MNYNEHPRIMLFPNTNAGQPIKKKDGSYVEDSNGNPVKHGEYSGKINLPEGLAAGDYEVSIYSKEYSDKKTGERRVMLSGRIKKAWVKPLDQHSIDKSNGYAPKSNHVEEELEEDPPF